MDNCIHNHIETGTRYEIRQGAYAGHYGHEVWDLLEGKKISTCSEQGALMLIEHLEKSE